jgi:hypothetical protein
MKLETGVQIGPSKDLIHGVEGVGKTSLGSTYPNAIFIDCEGSTDKLDVARLRARTWIEFNQAIGMILSKKDGFEEFESVVIDTVDWLEKIVITEVVRLDKADSITDHRLYGYGKGDQRVKAFFDDEVTPLFERLMKSGLNVVMIAHSVVKSFNDPIGGAYDYYGMDMGKKAAATLRQWAHNVFFVNYKTTFKEGKGIDKTKAYGGKEVCLYTQRTPQYEAKRRDALKDEIKVIEGVNPYPQIIGTEMLKAELEVELKDAMNDLIDISTVEDLTAHWKSNVKLHKNEDYKQAVSEKGEALKSETEPEPNTKEDE